MSIITVGIDLAKNVFAVHGVDDNGNAARSRTAPREWPTTTKSVPAALRSMNPLSRPTQPSHPSSAAE